MIEYPETPDMPRSHLPFSPVTKVGPLLFVSGQASVDAGGKIIPDTFEGEMRRSIENLARVLEAAGSDLAHVAQTRNYVRLPEDVPEFNRIYGEYFTHPLPARTTVANCLTPSLRFEIECIAVVRDDARAQGDAA